MNKYIKFIIIAALLACGANTLYAESSPKTNKVAKTGIKKSPHAARPAHKNSEARKKYVAAARKIREAVKAGKLTEAQAKVKYAALRKKIAPSRSSSKEALLKRFDKNKDGKLCDNEKAAMKKAIAERKKKDAKRGGKSRRERGGKPHRGGDRKKRPARK